MNDTAERLLDALDEVIADHGPSGVTLRRVGAQAGLSHAASTHYFTNKQGLFTAYITRAYDTVADGIEAALAIGDPKEAMLAAADSYAEFAVSQPSPFSIMTRLELVSVETPELWAARERGYFALAAIIEGARSSGWAAGRDLLDLIAVTWGMVHGIVDLWCGGPLAAPFDGHELRPVLRRLLGQTIDDIGWHGQSHLP